LTLSEKKKNKAKRAGCMVQVVECLSTMCKALGLIPSNCEKKDNSKKKRVERIVLLCVKMVLKVFFLDREMLV
jgi:hypothetical protein